MGIEVLLPEAAIEAFNLGVISWLARPAEVPLHSALIRPLVHDLGNELAAVVGLNRCWQTALCCYPIQCIDHVLPFGLWPTSTARLFRV